MKHPSKYERHQSHRECNRRLRQIVDGHLYGDWAFISPDTLEAAFRTQYGREVNARDLERTARVAFSARR